jgi:hypothetical protein
MNVLHFIQSPLESSWLFPNFSNYKQSHYTHSYTGFCVDMFSTQLGEYQRTQLLDLKVKSMLVLCQPVF